MSTIIQDDTRLRLKPGVDVTKLALSAQEGYLISRIQGEISVKDLYQLSMVDRNATAAMLKNLLDQGVLESLEKAAEVKSNADALLPKRDYGQFIFNLVELQEDIALSAALKKEILFVYDRMNDLNYYDFLGVEPAATTETIKKAFLNLSRVYHPDNYFRKELGSYKNKIQAIYAKLSEIQRVLNDSTERREYRRQLIENGVIEQTSEDIMEDPIQRKRRLDKLHKKSRLKRNPMQERVNKAREFFEAGMADMKREAWISAANNFKLARSFDPNNQLYQHKADEVRDQANRTAADRVYQRALVLESYGQDGYFEAFVKAAKTYPQGAEYNAKVANLFTDQMEWEEALPYAKRASVAEPNNVEFRLNYARILLRLKDKDEASKQLNQVLKREPNNEQAKAMLKEAKKWF